MTQRYSEARQQIIKAYEIVRQVGGSGTMVQRVATFMGRNLDCHGDHSHIRRTIKAYRQEIQSKQNSS